MSTPTEDQDLDAGAVPPSHERLEEIRIRMRISSRQWIREYIADALEAAFKLGYVAEVRLVATLPPRMGGYRPEIVLRDIRPGTDYAVESIQALTRVED